MDEVEMLEILREAIGFIELKEHYKEHPCNDLYEVELDKEKALQYIDEKIKFAKIKEYNRIIDED